MKILIHTERLESFYVKFLNTLSIAMTEVIGYDESLIDIFENDLQDINRMYNMIADGIHDIAMSDIHNDIAKIFLNHLGWLIEDKCEDHYLDIFVNVSNYIWEDWNDMKRADERILDFVDEHVDELRDIKGLSYYRKANNLVFFKERL